MTEAGAPDQPVPNWSERGEWEPIDPATGARAAWPRGFEPAHLPRPRYHLRERVPFLWKGRRRWGEIRDIRLLAATTDRPVLEYVVYTSGHGYWVTEDQLG